MVIAVCPHVTLHFILTLVQTELINHDKTVCHQVFYMYSHTWKWQLENIVYVEMYIIVHEWWLGDRIVTFGVMATVTQGLGEAEELHTILFLIVILSLIHMHTLLKLPPLSQCKNGHYILMEKRWPWLIILSLNNGSDTFSASMCL